MSKTPATTLSELRTGANLSQKTVADKMGVGQTRVSAIERTPIESVQVETLRAYAEAVGAKLEVSVKVGTGPRQLLHS